MNSKPFAQKKFLSFSLLAFFSVALIAWAGQKQTHQQKIKQSFSDTIPKNKTDKKIRDLDDAIDKGNSTIYGLASAVWTRDLKKAHRLASAIKAGTVWVNTYNMFDAASSLPIIK